MTRRKPPPSVTVDRGGRSRAPALKGVIALVVLGVLLIGGVAVYRWVQPHLAEGRALIETVMRESGLAESTPGDDGGRSRLELLHAALAAGDKAQALEQIPQLPPQEHNRVVEGMTSLMRAASMGDAQVVDWILRSGGDPNARGAAQRTALQYAAERNRIAAAGLLLDAGADINGVDNGGLAPLVMAADRDYTDLALLLIERGANVNLQNLEGWTALMDAARRGNTRVVEALLAAGARTGARHRDGRTALDFARDGKHAGVVRLLTGKPAPPQSDRPRKKGKRQ